MVEGGTPNTLQRGGITRDSIKIGTVIVVAGLQGQGRPAAGQRPRHHLPRRPHALHGIVGHRRAEGRSRPERAAQAQEAGALRCAHDFGSPLLARAVARRWRVGVRRRTPPRRRATARRARRRHAGSQRHLAGEQHGELGPRGARGAAGPGRSRWAPPSACRPASASSKAATIPYLPAALEKKKANGAQLDDARSRGQVLHAGDSARHLHAVSLSDRAVGRHHPDDLRVRERQPRRAHEQQGEEPGAGVDGMVDRTLGRRDARRSR